MDLILDYIEEPLGWAFNKYIDSLQKSLKVVANGLDGVSWRLNEAAVELRWVADAIGATIP